MQVCVAVYFSLSLNRLEDGVRNVHRNVEKGTTYDATKLRRPK
jgi:hypothetical protein